MKQLINGVPNEYLLLGGLALAAGVAYVVRKNASSIAPVTDAPVPNQNANNGNSNALPQSSGSSTPKASGSSTATALNKDLTLKKGMAKNAEVAELQRLLGFTGTNIDGLFGNATETALVARKAVKQITLNQFATYPDVNKNALAVGTRIMANKANDIPWSLTDGISIYKATPLADGSYSLQNDRVSNVAFGKEVGTVKMYNTTKTKYLISKPGESFIYGWVNANEVKKI